MHDIRAIRENPDAFDAALARRGDAPLSADLLALDEARRAKIRAAETAQAEQNKASKDVGAAKASGDEAEFERLLGNHFFEILCLPTQRFDLICVGRPCCISGEPLLPGLHEVLRPLVVDALRDAFTAAQLSNAILAAQAIKDDLDLLFR